MASVLPSVSSFSMACRNNSGQAESNLALLALEVGAAAALDGSCCCRADEARGWTPIQQAELDTPPRDDEPTMISKVQQVEACCPILVG